MKKNHFYKQDWFIALAVGIGLAAALVARNSWLERLELQAYDVGVRLTHRNPGAADQIVIVAIDNASIREIGPWPWPRSVLASALERLSKGEPRAVGVLLDLTQPRVDPGLAALRNIGEQVGTIGPPSLAPAQQRRLRALLNQAETDLDTDRALALALHDTPQLFLPMFVDVGEPSGKPSAPLPVYVRRQGLINAIPPSADFTQPDQITAIRAPLEAFARQASGIGHLRFRIDPDGGARAVYSVLEYDGQYFASLPLLLAASSLGLDARSIELNIGRGLRLGRLFVPVDAAGRTETGFYPPAGDGTHAFLTRSFRDLYAGTLAAHLFTNKIVLIGLTAGAAGARSTAPVAGPATAPPPEVAANVVAAILNQDFYTKSEWAPWLDIGLLGIVLLYLMFALPYLSGNTGALASLLLLIGLLGTEEFLLVSEKMWLRAVTPAALLVVGHLAIAAKRFLRGERRASEAELDSVHSNRMLGLTFQSQGQLDMAMDKYRKLPVDNSVLELIYNLALDFERKRQFLKAAAAYDYILEHDSGFHDCVERRKRASQGDQSIALGTLILDGAEKPTLGRYHIERELGRGAMGVVYLGRDPKINRRVAIKTMALAEEFDPAAREGAHERFFREAETAGRLHHPNIVTIYDVGEDHDLAYIAMEYLEGKELSTYLEPGKQLAFDRIADIAIKVADALAYAHRNDVVHRDIKPHNIFYDEASGGVKVMDFGIARLAAASRTKTGLVLGTPSYMSPEQIAGKRVDGRSDLFSFGAMLFELVTGETPFDGDSFAALTHQIINAPTPDIRKLRPDTPPRLAAIIKRLLQKKLTKRYQSADELKHDLEECRDELDEWAKS
jgi:eukaryotic-like serine/threonine-protein kinase